MSIKKWDFTYFGIDSNCLGVIRYSKSKNVKGIGLRFLCFTNGDSL